MAEKQVLPYPLRIPEKLKAQAKKKAASIDRSLNWYINNLIEADLNKRKP